MGSNLNAKVPTPLILLQLHKYRSINVRRASGKPQGKSKFILSIYMKYKKAYKFENGARRFYFLQQLQFSHVNKMKCDDKVVLKR